MKILRTTQESAAAPRTTQIRETSSGFLTSKTADNPSWPANQRTDYARQYRIVLILEVITIINITSKCSIVSSGVFYLI